MRSSWLAVAAMLTLAVLVVASRAPRRPSVGYVIDVAISPEDRGNQRTFVASAVGRHRVTLGLDLSIDIRELPSQLRELLKYRAEKLVSIRAEPGVSFSEFLQLVDAVRPEAGIISLITPQIDALAGARYCLAPSCGRCTNLRSFRLRRNANLIVGITESAGGL